ncbi:MAG TPA: hypothetical protein VEB21_10755 [Terriglobales bacterium]|nr:hypothetical protein [Terriglobales bacterium]
MRFSRTALLLLSLTVSACSARARPAPQADVPVVCELAPARGPIAPAEGEDGAAIDNADEIVRQVLAREQERQSLRATFDVEVSYGGGERRAGGALVVRKPDRFRMRLLTPFGVTVFDYLQREGRSWVWQPLGAGGSTSERNSLQLFSERGMGAAFLGQYDVDPATCRIQAQTADCPAGGERTIRIDLAQQVIVEDHHPQAHIRYSEHRLHESHNLPAHISICADAGRLAVQVSIKTYEVDVPLPDDLFQPPSGAGQ